MMMDDFKDLAPHKPYAQLPRLQGMLRGSFVLRRTHRCGLPQAQPKNLLMMMWTLSWTRPAREREKGKEGEERVRGEGEGRGGGEEKELYKGVEIRGGGGLWGAGVRV